MKLTDTNRFYMPGQTRFLHLATVQDNCKEFICMFDLQDKQMYIEEITGGHLETIKDDVLFESVYKFLEEKTIIDMGRPMIPDKEWYYTKPTLQSIKFNRRKII